MKIGFLFPGQGTQSVGMGKDLYDKYEEVRDVYKTISEFIDIDVAKLTFESDEEILNKTQNTQIAILTMSLGILKILEKNGINAEATAGLSLGEYTALIYSKILSFEEGVKIVKKRGEYMQNLVPEGTWLMAAILGTDEKIIEEACSEIQNGFAVPVNFNCPGQIVISGDKEGVEEAVRIMQQKGVRKIKTLNTSGPFHTEKLFDASNALKEELNNIEIYEGDCNVFKNLDGKVYKKEDDVRQILAKHIISPVKFQDCLEGMLEMGIDTFIEIGPGKTLSGFIKKFKTDKEINILNINSEETLEKTMNFINGGGITG